MQKPLTSHVSSLTIYDSRLTSHVSVTKKDIRLQLNKKIRASSSMSFAISGKVDSHISCAHLGCAT
jgi:hypothetical protein